MKRKKKTLAFYAIGDDITPSTRFRVLPWIHYLRQAGWQVRFYSLPSLKGGRFSGVLELFWQGIVRYFQLLQASHYEVIIVQKGLTPARFRWLTEFFLKLNIPYLYDFDDAVYVEAPILLPKALRWLQEEQEPERLIRNASSVVAGNSHLAGHVFKMNVPCAVVPTPIDTEEYVPQENPAEEKKVIGWSGSVSTNFYVNDILPVLQKLGEKHRFDFLVISNNLQGIHLPEGLSFGFKFIPWSPCSAAEDLRKMTLGIMPMTEDEWARGKCGIKALLYMSVGLPVIVSPIGVNKEIVEPGKNGLWATSEEEWEKALGTLLADTGLCRSLGREARKTVEERYSVKFCAPLFVREVESMWSKVSEKAEECAV